jgi:hypothetical protein
MRMAQARARNQRFHLNLPPLENMHAVQSALTQLMEAVAEDMIDLKHANFLLSLLRQAANNFKKPEAWRASEYHNDRSAPSVTSYEEFEAEFGLPENLDLKVPPEVAFPAPETDTGCPVPAGFAGAGVFADGDTAPSPAASVSSGPIPQPDFPCTPYDMELNEINRTEGTRAMIRRADEIERNRMRREQRQRTREAYERYSVLAYNRNIQLSAEMMLAQKLAEDHAAAQAARSETPSTKKPPAAVTPEVSPMNAKSTA